MTDLEIVQAAYGAFARGDVDTFLSFLHDDVRWEDWPDNHAQKAGVPYLAARRGKAEVPGFFGALAGIELRGLEPIRFLSGLGAVAVEVEISFVVKSTGKLLTDQEVHLWSLEGGKVTRLRHYADTAKHIEANRAG